ncbi:MAG: hypothetical protein ACK5WZ_05240 [Pseudobdellovibrionaceae bacterium]
MKNKLLIAGLLLLFCNCETGANKPVYSNKKVETVNPDYGILPESYRTRSGARPLMWRCFPIKDVEVKYRTWRDADPMGPYDVIVTMCDFEIWMNSKPFQNVYHGRRGKPESYCKTFEDAWSKLTKGEEYICMDGETLTKGEPEEDEDSKKMRVSWTWDKIKTKKGCYSFWDGYQCVDF